MHLTHFLLPAFFAILTHAHPQQRSHPHGYLYEQRDASNSTSTASSIPSTDSSSSSSPSSSSSSSSSSSTNNNNAALPSTASFTQYSPCNVTSCGWYSSSGYNAAISQAVYGGSPGSGASAACGVCWQLTPEYPGAKGIVVKVNNLCPDDGNPLCAQPADVDINFDLCQDSGAAAALFGSSGTEQVNGTAVKVSCDQWSGGGNVCMPGVQSC